jgi:hypothetical protein
MITPSGRFQVDKKICTSMTSFHPSTWNPAWSVATILTGLLSFMLSDENTTGSIASTIADKRSFAEKSHAWNLTNKKFRVSHVVLSDFFRRAHLAGGRWEDSRESNVFLALYGLCIVPTLQDMFPDYVTPLMKDVPDMGVPPAPSAPGTNAPPSVGSHPPSTTSTSSSLPSGSPSSQTQPSSSSSSSSSPPPISSPNHPPTTLFKRSAINSIPSSSPSIPSPNIPSHNPLGLITKQETGMRAARMSWGKWIAVAFAALVLGRLGSLLSQG